MHALYTLRVSHQVVRLLVKYIDSDAAGRQTILSISVPFRSIRPGGGQGDRLAEIWTSAILRVDRGHLPDSAKVKVRPLVLLVVVVRDAELTPELSVIS